MSVASYESRGPKEDSASWVSLWILGVMIIGLVPIGWGYELQGGLLGLVLGFYCYLLFIDTKRAGANHSPKRLAPWVILVLTLAGTFKVVLHEFYLGPYPTPEPVKTWQGVEMEIEGLKPGMSAEEVKAVLGQPGETRLANSGKPALLNASETLEILEFVVNAKFTDGQNIKVQGNLDIAELKPLLTQLASVERKWVPGGTHASRLHSQKAGFVQRVHRGEALTVLVVEQDLDEVFFGSFYEKYGDLMERRGDFLLLSTSGQPNGVGCLTTSSTLASLGTKTHRQWVYPERGLKIDFSLTPENIVASIEGPRAVLGTRVWAQVGQDYRTLMKPGQAPKPFGDRTFVKKWQGQTLTVWVDEELKVQRLQLGSVL